MAKMANKEELTTEALSLGIVVDPQWTKREIMAAIETVKNELAERGISPGTSPGEEDGISHVQNIDESENSGTSNEGHASEAIAPVYRDRRAPGVVLTGRGTMRVLS